MGGFSLMTLCYTDFVMWLKNENHLRDNKKVAIFKIVRFFEDHKLMIYFN